MSSTVDNHTAPRSRDSEGTRAALLRGARSAFDELGYELATTREIGERAGVDPALIARYFGSKEGLFLASIAYLAEDEDEVELDAALPYLLERWERHGHNPISRALTSLALSEEMRRRVASVVAEWLRHQLGPELAERGVENAELRAELIVAIAVGVATVRANGTLEAIAGAGREEVLAALAPAIECLVAPPPA